MSPRGTRFLSLEDQPAGRATLGSKDPGECANTPGAWPTNEESTVSNTTQLPIIRGTARAFGITRPDPEPELTLEQRAASMRQFFTQANHGLSMFLRTPEIIDEDPAVTYMGKTRSRTCPECNFFQAAYYLAVMGLTAHYCQRDGETFVVQWRFQR